MKKWLATFGTALTISLAGCSGEAPTTPAGTLESPTTTTATAPNPAPVDGVIVTTQDKVTDACNYKENPSKAKAIATREQKGFWIEAHGKLKEALAKYKYVPSGAKPERDGTTYYKWWRDDVAIIKTDSKNRDYPWAYYDVTIKLQSPVTIKWRQYDEIYLNVTPNPSFSLTKFQNSWDDFPKLRFWHSHGRGDDSDILCLSSRYYDDVDWIILSNGGSLGKAVPFEQENFSSLIEIALEKLRK